MSTHLEYLSQGLIDNGGIRENLQLCVRGVAEHWYSQNVDVQQVEIMAEYLARLGRYLQEEVLLSRDELSKEVQTIYGHKDVILLLESALPEDLGALDINALALHLMDIAEYLSLRIYVPVLPEMLARSERSAKAARSVGLAQHLRG